ncbi:MAG: ABC transporter permease [Actinomycetota bacterium]
MRLHPIARALVRRIAASIAVLWCVSVLLFAATVVLPGDPAMRILGQDATPENLEELRARLGLDRPAPVQYADWLGDVLTGDMGTTNNGTPVGPLLSQRVTNSLVLAAVAAVLTVTIALALGVTSGLRAGRAEDSALSVAALVGVSIPDFVVAGLLISVFAFVLDWFPPVSLLLAGDTPFDRPSILVLPAVALAVPAGAWASRYVRAAVVDARTAPNVEAARLAGLPSRRVVFRHLLPGLIGPTAQVFAAATGFLVGGAVVVEAIFAYPGVGSLLTDAVAVEDIDVILASGLTMATAVVVSFLLADLAGLVSNPRLRARP